MTLTQTFRDGFRPPFTGEIYEYARKINLQDGYARTGLFDVHTSRYLIDVFKALKNPRVRSEVNLKAVQTGGSLTSDLTTPYRIEHDPGPSLLLMQDDDFAKKYCDTRLMPMLERIPEIAARILAIHRHSKTKTEILLPGMPFIVGGLNEGNVQSLSWRYVTVDEGWRAKSNGLIRQSKARTTAFPHSSKFHVISQAGTEGDDLDIEWELTNQQEWAWRCRGCGKLNIWAWSERRTDNTWCGMLWDTNERTKPGGKWRMGEVLNTIRAACKFCPEVWIDTAQNRRRVDETSEYVITNPDALPENSGHRWTAMANVDISFASLVEQYLNAKTQEEEFGYKLPLMEFYQKRLAQPWSLNRDAGAVVLRSENYNINEAWPEEAYRFMTVDPQKDFTELRLVIRAWSKNGASRQLSRRLVESFDEVEKAQREFNVADQRVFVDVGYEQTKVARECARRGHWGIISGKRRWLCWNGLKGSDRESFTHKVPKLDAKGRQVRLDGKLQYRNVERIYSPQDFLDANLGMKSRLMPCPYWVWSNLHVKDILKRHRDGLAGKWDCLPDTDALTDMNSFTNQIHSEICVREKDKFGRKKRRWIPVSTRRANHFWDIEAMQIVPALLASIMGDAEPPPEDAAGDAAAKEEKKE